LRTLGLDGRSLGGVRVAAIGSATAEALDALFLHADLVPEEYVAESLMESLAGFGDLAGQRFLLLRADIARTALNDALDRLGAKVVDAPIYRTRATDALPDELLIALGAGAGRVGWITFTSSSTVRNFLTLAPEATRAALADGAIRAASIGPITSKTFTELVGRGPDVTAVEHTIDGLVRAILQAASTGA